MWYEHSNYLLNLQMSVLGLLKFFRNYSTPVNVLNSEKFEVRIDNPLSTRVYLAAVFIALFPSRYDGAYSQIDVHISMSVSLDHDHRRREERSFIRKIQWNLRLNHRYITFIFFTALRLNPMSKILECFSLVVKLFLMSVVELTTENL